MSILAQVLRFLGALASAIGTFLLAILGIATFFAALIGGGWLVGTALLYWTNSAAPVDTRHEAIALGTVGLVGLGWTILIGTWIWDGIKWTREAWRKAGRPS